MVTAAERRAMIVAAARGLFLRNGLRGTSMEAIAQAAGIAKPTLYAYFPDKTALFLALVTATLDSWREVTRRALQGDGDVVDRINRALVDKHRAVQALLAGSPHAAEIYETHDGVAAAQFAAFEAELADDITAELVRAGVPRARFLAQVLLAASAGIGRRATQAAELGPAMRLLTERLLRPEFAAGAQDPLTIAPTSG